MRKRLCIALVLAAALMTHAATKKPTPVPLLKKADQAVEIQGIKVLPPVQKCNNWGWAASIETLLRLQDVRLDQRFWITKLNSGELCLDELASFEDMAQAIDGEYIIGVNKKVQLKTTYARGAPTVPDQMITSLRDGMPMIFFWKGHPYLMVGMTYDEYLGPNNARIFHVKQMKLLDPMAAEDDPQRNVVFVRDQDNIADIDGTMTVQATPVE
jgi:hypothetical protein